ncbi:MAG: phosphoenolpyruvate carboxykinase (ATP) [Deltaproteobacteria bacterium]|nr:phosphoenolpyruvate carboxykinase (ATP) [Deltaproteobacteria bacterium]
MNLGSRQAHYDLEHHGIKNIGTIYWNPTTPVLYEEIVRRREGVIAHLGPIVVRTGHHTGRSPNDKRIVREKTSSDKIWWSPVNVPMEPEKFEVLYFRLLAYLQGKDVFVQDCYAGADPKYQVPIRIITETAWHNLFSRNMFVQIKESSKLAHHVPKFTIINVPKFHALPELDGTNSEAFIIVNFGKRLILIGGTIYAGEIKKSVFTVLNYLYPQEKVMSMHCSANVGQKGDVAIFFGLSGTGKTTLSADPERLLIGDDEHGWSDKGIFNFEGGCYAKVIRLSEEAEPEIYECTRKFGTILENVAIDNETRRIDLNDGSLTENTRAAYPISHISRAIRSGLAGHPQNIIMLTYDAFGVLPPIARLTPEQAMYQFLSGYTAKVAGTEKGLGKEPQATFSTCFGAPFMALPPTVYAELLGERIKKHKVKCWLVNTGLSGGPFGLGERLKIAYTRAMIHQALNGKLDNVPTETDPIFNLRIPTACEGVPKEILNPRNTWRKPKDYDTKARDLAERFKENFKQFADKVSTKVKKAGPAGS